MSLHKTAFVWVIDASRSSCWWDRLYFTVGSLDKILPKDSDVDYKILECGTINDCDSRRRFIDKYGIETIIQPDEEWGDWISRMYRDFRMTEFCPAILLRLILPRLRQLEDFDTIISVDIDSEWRGGVKELITSFHQANRYLGMVQDPFWKCWRDRLPFGKFPRIDDIENAIKRPFPCECYLYHGAGLICFRPNLIPESFWLNISSLLELGKSSPFGWPEQDILNLSCNCIESFDSRYAVFDCECEERKKEAYLIQYAGSDKHSFDKKVEEYIKGEHE